MERQMVSYEAYDSMENPYSNYEVIKEANCKCGCEKCQQTQENENTQFIKVAYDNPQIKVSPAYIQGEINREQPEQEVEVVRPERIKVINALDNQPKTTQTTPPISQATPITKETKEAPKEKSLIPLGIAIVTITLCVYFSNKPQATAKSQAQKEISGLGKTSQKHNFK